jgi:Protein of unknown function (DUF3999)
MIRRSSVLFVTAVLFAAALLAVGLPQQWRSWRYSRAVLDPSMEGPSHSGVSLPWDLVARCSMNCADVRLIDDRGQEVPFELSVRRADSHSESYNTRLVENSFVHGQYTQLIADAGEKPPLYDRVGVETGKADFIVWAELALSDDEKTWRVVEPRAPIARFRSRSVDGSQTISFQGLNSRYIRVRIFDPEAQFPVSGVLVLFQSSLNPERSEIPASFSPSNLSAPGESAWQANLHSASLPVSEVRFSSDSQEFYRAVRLAGSQDGKLWSYISSGTIYRYLQGDKVRESLHIDFPEAVGNSFLRIEVVNGDDQPLANVKIALFGIPRILLFKQEAGRTYRVLYGNERARAPRYDLARYLDFGPPKPAYRILPLGGEELTSNYADPRPFTERHPVLLWLALAIAVLLLGYTAMRTLRPPATHGR